MSGISMALWTKTKWLSLEKGTDLPFPKLGEDL